MRRLASALLALALAAPALTPAAHADNPLLMNTFAADPTARVFEGKIYLYPSHDFVPGGGRRSRGFNMEDYHAYSSENLMDWTDHGVIVTQTKVPWVKPNNGMWAPDCVFKDGKYYFYFPANSNDTSTRPQGIQHVGVAIADHPGGPFTPEPTYIPDSPPAIDPCVLIDPKDGQAYLFDSMNAIFVAKLKPNMTELAEQPKKIDNLPTQGLVEGPFAFERNGKYYLTFPHDVGGGEALEYAMADSPEGPYTMKGTIMDKHTSGCWTNHHSIVQYQGKWILFYHDNDLSPRSSTLRSARADYLTFNDDGTINKVIPTLRGVGVRDATSRIQLDRYSAVSPEGTKVSYIDDQHTSKGWKIALSQPGAFVQYDRVAFGEGALKKATLRARSAAGATVELHQDSPDGPLLAKFEIPKSEDWQTQTTDLATTPKDQHNLVATLTGDGSAEIDWASFE